MSSLRVAVVGATGAVGPEVLRVLRERSFPAASVTPFASARSAGTRVAFGGEELEVRELTDDALEGFDLALFSAGGSTSAGTRRKRSGAGAWWSTSRAHSGWSRRCRWSCPR